MSIPIAIIASPVWNPNARRTINLSVVFVREAAERWPSWWDDRFGPPHQEADVPPLGRLRESLMGLRLLRRRGRRLLVTKRGRELTEDLERLVAMALPDLGGGVRFHQVLAAGVLIALQDGPDGVPIGELIAAAGRHAHEHGWRPVEDAGDLLDRGPVREVHQVLGHAEAFGLLEWPSAPPRERFRPPVRLLETGRRVRVRLDPDGAARLRLQPVAGAPGDVLHVDARLVSGFGTPVGGVAARIAIRADDDFVALHHAIQEAFGWLDDHLWSIWLDGRFWGAADQEIRIPGGDDFMDADGARDGDELTLAQAGIARPGAVVAYLFDYGDEWRVRVTVREIGDAGDGPLPRVVERTGEAPPQYPPLREV